MAGNGGKREGAGRPKKSEAEKAQKMCRQALMDRYGVGTWPEALSAIAADRSLESSVVKFILNHALGNVPQTVNNVHEGPKGEALIPAEITVKVVRTIHNAGIKVGNDTDTGNDHNS